MKGVRGGRGGGDDEKGKGALSYACAGGKNTNVIFGS